MDRNSGAVTVDRPNPFALTGQAQRIDNGGGMIQVASSRQAQEVQAMMAVAKRFPRNQEEAFNRVMVACQRRGLAESSMYSYPKGGQQITGPSIRLAEALAQNWGNLDFGIIELEQRHGESTVMAYAVDLETNTRQTKVFQVPHERKARGQISKLDDPREVYELVANQGARRLRSCILGVIPGDIIDAAIDQCEKTLKGGKEPLIDRIRIMAQKFQEDFQVTVPMIEKRLQHKLDATNEQELVNLRKIYVSLRDAMGKREDYFEFVDNVASPTGLGGDDDQPPQESKPNVPNPELGADKPKGRKKPEAPAKPALGTKEAYILEIRELAQRDSVDEKDVVKVLVGLGLIEPGTGLEFAPTILLRDLTAESRWTQIVKDIAELQ